MHNRCPFFFFETASDVDFDIVFFTELDGPDVHNAGTETCQFQHFIVTNLVHLRSVFEYSRVGRVDSIDVGINFALFGPQCRS